MSIVRISNVAVAHPPGRISQAESAHRIGEYAGQPRRVAAIARGTGIEQRAIAIPPDDLVRLGRSGERNDVYRAVAPGLALQAAGEALGCAPRDGVAALVTSSCTGYMAPSLAVRLSSDLGLPARSPRLPVTEAGCAGGVVALAAAADHLRARGGRSARVA
ncbi:MAG: hypothetical protein WD800_04350, partial [Dehalococcoidia bacterium]